MGLGMPTKARAIIVRSKEAGNLRTKREARKEAVADLNYARTLRSRVLAVADGRRAGREELPEEPGELVAVEDPRPWSLFAASPELLLVLSGYFDASRLAALRRKY